MQTEYDVTLQNILRLNINRLITTGQWLDCSRLLTDCI